MDRWRPVPVEFQPKYKIGEVVRSKNHEEIQEIRCITLQPNEDNTGLYYTYLTMSGSEIDERDIEGVYELKMRC